MLLVLPKIYVDLVHPPYGVNSKYNEDANNLNSGESGVKENNVKEELQNCLEVIKDC